MTLGEMRHAGRMTFSGVRRVLAFALLAMALSSCGSSSDVSPPAGVDELTIPTQSPDPEDFVDRVDNPWFPLEPGTVWTYVGSGSDGERTRTVTVLEGVEQVQGVATTLVRDLVETANGEVATDVTDLYAQDTSGNVWWFGRRGEWEAGADGAEAGVVMLASPRVGDGYRSAFLEGEIDAISEVQAVGEQIEVVAGAFDDVVTIKDRMPLVSTGSELSYYARGTGLVSQVAEDGSGERLELVEVRSP